MSHTPEPWRAEWQPGQTPKHTYTHCVMCGDDSLCDTLTQADAERIVACVNACTGMADPAGEIARLRAALQVLRSKGQQYYNENAPGDTEFRAIMGFVYDTANIALSANGGVS